MADFRPEDIVPNMPKRVILGPNMGAEPPSLRRPHTALRWVLEVHVGAYGGEFSMLLDLMRRILMFAGNAHSQLLPNPLRRSGEKLEEILHPHPVEPEWKKHLFSSSLHGTVSREAGWNSQGNQRYVVIILLSECLKTGRTFEQGAQRPCDLYACAEAGTVLRPSLRVAAYYATAGAVHSLQW
ncbi:hypothetical protein WOLCODRAFT_19620 [Wolfiporia cocos MD-104 SS10]|uniref:Uncharacterized protein n=1 Tax=Wolfiporia cocos (strain MD-104) TaxID=742152 RepID=A0A2H3JDR8_WOLCO|nr:hypothetical protein WOLCODRAFT_19620 [Wolfiporia cocos MD-104 SS10]